MTGSLQASGYRPAYLSAPSPLVSTNRTPISMPLN
jgi:hypothetical protein